MVLKCSSYIYLLFLKVSSMELTITLFPLNDARFFTKEELNDDDPNNNIEKGIIKDDEFESEEPSVDEVLFENLIGSRIGSGRRMRARRLIFRYLKDSMAMGK